MSWQSSSPPCRRGRPSDRAATVDRDVGGGDRSISLSDIRESDHDKLAALSEKERNEKLSYAVQDEGCRVTRSFFQGLDKSGNAFWNVACANRETRVIMIRNDAQGSTRVLECGVMKAMGGTECFKKF